MASSKTRQRALARAKTERQIARRAASARRRRQLQAGIGGAVVLALAVVGAIWVTGGFKPDPVTPADCAWTPREAAEGANLKDVGMPPTTGIPKSGSKSMSITTDQGVITALLDLSKAPCTAASFTHLASKQFFDNTKCHRLTSAVLQCGDPSGTGSGGPTYRFPNENVPPALPATSPDPAATAAPPTLAAYPRGTLAMANSGTDTNGSQFFIVYKDTQFPANYTVLGAVTGGLDTVVDKIAAGGITPGATGDPNDGAPKIATTIQTLTVTDQAPAAPQPSATTGAPATSGAPTPGATPSGSGTP